LSDLSIVGIEALIRWNPKSPSGEAITSEELVQIAENTGFISQLDQFAVLEACAAMKRMDKLLADLPITINLSALQLHRPEFVDFVSNCIQEHNVNPSQLKIEITESAAMKDIELSILQLNRLKNLGLKVSIDDFGTGYSSLNYLKRLPVDSLQIGKNFLHEISTEQNDRGSDVVIMQAIITLGQTLNFKVTAEGIENEAQKELLIELGCEEGQGFHLSAPLRECELVDKIRSASIGKVA